METMDSCRRDAGNFAEIKSLVAHADEAIAAALREIAMARSTLTDLCGRHVYDIEMAEGTDGSDAAAELEHAALSLRHVHRIISARRRLLEQEA